MLHTQDIQRILEEISTSAERYTVYFTTGMTVFNVAALIPGNFGVLGLQHSGMAKRAVRFETYDCEEFLDSCYCMTAAVLTIQALKLITPVRRMPNMRYQRSTYFSSHVDFPSPIVNILTRIQNTVPQYCHVRCHEIVRIHTFFSRTSFVAAETRSRARTGTESTTLHQELTSPNTSDRLHSRRRIEH